MSLEELANERAKREALRPLSPEEAAREHLCPLELDLVIEKGRRALAELEEASRYGQVGIRQDLRFTY